MDYQGQPLDHGQLSDLLEFLLSEGLGSGQITVAGGEGRRFPTPFP